MIWAYGMVSSWLNRMASLFFFFFQAEDGIRDSSVTGVQTCALPICDRSLAAVGSSCQAWICYPCPCTDVSPMSVSRTGRLLWPPFLAIKKGGRPPGRNPASKNNHPAGSKTKPSPYQSEGPFSPNETQHAPAPPHPSPHTPKHGH